MEQEKLQELLRERLKEKGLKVTHQRMLVLLKLAEHKDEHLTAEDLYGMISQDYPEIGLATIYRALQLLWDMKLIDRINLDDGCVRYEMGHLFEDENRHNHHHLICRSCGSVTPFGDDLLDSVERQIEDRTGFHVLDHELKFYGICSACAKQEHKDDDSVHTSQS